MPKIKCTADAEPTRVLEVVRRVAGQRGYLWEPDGKGGAIASEGGREIRNRATATKLRLRVHLDGRKLRLRQQTTGAVYTGAAGVPFFQVRLNSELSRFRKLTKEALAGAGLA